MINKKLQNNFINNVDTFIFDYNCQRFGIYYSNVLEDYISISNHIGKIEYNPLSSKFHYEEEDKQYFNYCYNLINMFYLAALWKEYYK
nr:MAG TPA: hypothetical protein [Caudoviricetes sp.]